MLDQGGMHLRHVVVVFLLRETGLAEGAYGPCEQRTGLGGYNRLRRGVCGGRLAVSGGGGGRLCGGRALVVTVAGDGEDGYIGLAFGFDRVGEVGCGVQVGGQRERSGKSFHCGWLVGGFVRRGFFLSLMQ